MPFWRARGDRGRERGFAVVNVTDRADVHVRLVAFKCFLSHFDSPFKLNFVFLVFAAGRELSGAHDRD
jgi:hypothetical protein